MKNKTSLLGGFSILFILLASLLFLSMRGQYVPSPELISTATQNLIPEKPTQIEKDITVINDLDNLFDGERALRDITYQVDLGPRIPGSNAHRLAENYIGSELEEVGWNVTIFEHEINKNLAINILATRNTVSPVILLGAHYDSRIIADKDGDTSKRSMPVPGANDGASGVAVLLEIARTLPPTSIPTGLLFIDIEDNGNIPDWDWILGSRAFARDMQFLPKAVIIVDMVGDANLNIYMEKNSDPELNTQIWTTAKSLGYDFAFIPEYKYNVLDDHIPFKELGIRVVDIIDLDYPYWHTTQDTPDKVSAKSLKIVGDTLMKWLLSDALCLEKLSCKQ